MKRIFYALILTAMSFGFAFAQSGTDYKKAEVFVGYSNNQVDNGADASNAFAGFISRREAYHGVNASAVYNVSRYFGLKADFSAAYNSRNFSFTVTPGSTLAFDTKNSLYNFLGGIQIKNNSTAKRWKPFVHALVGVGHGRTKVSNLSCPAGVGCAGIVSGSETGLAGAFGGGLDIKLSDHVDLRAIQVDYNPIKFDGGVQQNIRFGIGLVFK